MKPVIGINTAVSRGENESPDIATRATYVDAVIAAGGVPVLLPATDPGDLVEQHVRLCDGFVFIGGPDIRPDRYGKAPHPAENRIPERREEYDFRLIEIVIRNGKPFLAVCLGCQEVNVALGGTLIQDIVGETSTSIRHIMKQTPYFLRHDVAVETGTLLHDLVGTTTLSTNSSHHQSVASPAERLRVTARSADGIIEALELKDYGFGVCVQWHPEHLTSEPLHLKLFEGLVKAALNTRKPG
jgi:putative glutamine amidotransferase